MEVYIRAFTSILPVSQYSYFYFPCNILSNFFWLIFSSFILYSIIFHLFVAVQSLSCIQLFATPWTAACQASLSFIISWSLLTFMSIVLVMPSNIVIFCPPPFSSCPQSFPASGFFSSESALCIRWPKYLKVYLLHCESKGPHDAEYCS